MTRLLLEGGLVLDEAVTGFAEQDVLIQNGRIAALGPRGAFAAVDAARVEASGRLVIPGLVNAHGHGHGYFSKGVNAAWPLELLIAAAPWITAQRDVETCRLSVAVGAAEMLVKGCTTAVDLFTFLPIPTAEAFAAVAEAYRDLGMRATIAPMVADIPFWHAMPGLLEHLAAAGVSLNPGPAVLGTDAIVAAVEAALSVIPEDDVIRAGVCAAIPLSCTDHLLDALARIATERGMMLHTHFLESALQGPFWMRNRGEALVEGLIRRGIVNDRFVAAHAIWASEDDIIQLARAGAMVAHNPVSNMRLGTGIPPVRRYLDAGVTIGVGTDTCSCADNLNMFEAMRCAANLSRFAGPDPSRWLTPSEVLKAATQGGARIAGRADDIGRIAVGYRADLVLIDLSAPHYLPLNDPLTQLVHAEDGTGVDKVLVGGELVVSGGKPLRCDLGRLRDEARLANERLMERVEPARDAFESMAPALNAFRLKELARL
jgi:cytosine/adenosine deaminase-related metal-dependent hydrolase